MSPGANMESVYPQRIERLSLCLVDCPNLCISNYHAVCMLAGNWYPNDHLPVLEVAYPLQAMSRIKLLHDR